MTLRATLCRVLAAALFCGGWAIVSTAQEASVEDTAAEVHVAAEDAAEEKPASLTDRLVDIARARVKQHELRIETLRKLGDLHQALAKTRIARTKSQLEEFRAQREVARAELLMRESEFKRVELLRDKNVLDEQTFLEAQTNRAAANANVGRASAAVDRAEAEIHSAEFEQIEMELESALRVTEAALALLDAQEELARVEETQRRFRSLRTRDRPRGGRESAPPPADSSDSSAAPTRR